MSVATADGLANEGHNLVIVSLVDTNLHIRIFDADGKRVVDKAEDELTSGETLTTLKKQLNPLPDESGLSQAQKQQIIRDATSIAGHTLDDRNKLRYAYIIDSLKHPDEVDLLRTLFRDAFCMIGVVADDSVRKRRLLDQKQIQENEFKNISDAESKKADIYDQNPMDAILKSDYFFENNYDTPDKINQECKRLLNLLFQSSIVTPRQDECGMRLAFTAAKGSACLSRQVGAAIISSHNTVLATGCNDVPRFGGGLYSSEALIDNRCFAKSMMCHNDNEKAIIASEIVEALKKSIQCPKLENQKLEEIQQMLLKGTRLKQLIEFSRAVHAEMNALISVARTAVPGLVGSTLYVTTYPCHNCAKHIIDAGIKRVVFVEPYVKSLAQRLHADAINNPLEDYNNNKVSFDNYGGVSAERYSHFFSVHRERKKDGKFIRKSLEKDMLLPLGAQEIDNLKKRLMQFKEWFEKKGSSTVLVESNADRYHVRALDFL